MGRKSSKSSTLQQTVFKSTSHSPSLETTEKADPALNVLDTNGLTDLLEATKIDEPKPITTSKHFCDPSADVIFQSADNVLFHIHRKNLDVTADNFPLGGTLTEASDTLDLLFTFVYPNLHPYRIDLSSDVKQFFQFAEAADKYKVFCAMDAANAMMKAAIFEHPIEVMNYAFKYEYPELLDSAAPFTLTAPLDGIAGTMNPVLLPSWLRYCHAWLEACHSCNDPKLSTFTTHWVSPSEYCPSYVAEIAGLNLSPLVPDIVAHWIKGKVMYMQIDQVQPCNQWCPINSKSFANQLREVFEKIPAFSKFS